MDDLSNFLGGMGAVLWERATFDLRECTNFAEFNVPIIDCDPDEDAPVNELHGGSWGYVSKAAV